jgi:hypothetical protein
LLHHHHHHHLPPTGTPAKVFRIWLPYADPDAEVVLEINYQGTPNSRFVWTEATGRLEPLAAPPQAGDSSGTTPGGLVGAK